MKSKIEPVRVWHAVERTVISTVFLIAIIFLINISPNYVKEAKVQGTSLIINTNNVTKNLKSAILEKDGEYYLSTDDYKNFFDEFLIEDSDNIITTSNTKSVKISRFRQTMYVNGSNINVNYKPVSNDNKTYLALKEMADVYNFQYNYNEDTDTILISPLSKKLVQATASKILH